MRPDVIVFHAKVLAAPHIAEKLGARPILAALQPMLVPTGAFPAAGVPALPLGGWFNRLTYKAVAAGYGAYAGAIDRFRRAALGLSKAPKGMWAMRDAKGLRYRSCTASAAMSFRIRTTGHVNGYWTPPGDLADFLAAGPAPVFIGFGSIAGRDLQGLAHTVVSALEKPVSAAF